MLTSTVAPDGPGPGTTTALPHPSRWTETGGDESELLAALKTGQEWAFEALVRSSSRRLLAVARRFSSNDADAQDTLQSAYLNAFRSISRFQGEARLSTWLHRIVVNTALMKLRSRRRKPEESIEELLPAFHADGRHAERLLDWGAPADELLEQKETRAIVRAAITQLPHDYRTVLILRDIEELTTREVAGMLGITPAAVKTRLHRARQGLSTLLRRRFAAVKSPPSRKRHPTSDGWRREAPVPAG